jgi:hypothetical protein
MYCINYTLILGYIINKEEFSKKIQNKYRESFLIDFNSILSRIIVNIDEFNNSNVRAFLNEEDLKKIIKKIVHLLKEIFILNKNKMGIIIMDLYNTDILNRIIEIIGKPFYTIYTTLENSDLSILYKRDIKFNEYKKKDNEIFETIRRILPNIQKIIIPIAV